jgi:hypothetical protein
MAMPILNPELQGYPKLAVLMGEFPEVAIFRRFGTLTMINLMSLQAELIQIEEQLRTKQLQDRNETYSTNFSTLNNTAISQPGAPNHPNQAYLLDLSRRKLSEYRLSTRPIIISQADKV